jgi:hypothetical protein
MGKHLPDRQDEKTTAVLPPLLTEADVKAN